MSDVTARHRMYWILSLAIAKNLIGNEDSLILRSDNGSQMSVHVFALGIKKLPAEHEFVPARTPNTNAHIKSFFSVYDLHLLHQYF